MANDPFSLIYNWDIKIILFIAKKEKNVNWNKKFLITW
jgi:hypothetical protein